MTPAEGTDMDGVQDMNGAKELSSTPVSLDWEASTDLKSTPKVDDDSVNIVQQLEYVAISRATDTATVISNNVKEEGSPLHPEKSIKETKKNNNGNVIKYTEPRLKNRFDIPPFTTVKEVTENLGGYFEGGGANIFHDFPNATEADVNRLNGYYMGGEEYDLTDAQVVELGNKILGYNKINSNNNGTEEYKTTDEFKRVQEGSRKFTEKGLSPFNQGVRELDDLSRGRIGGVLERLLDSQRDDSRFSVRTTLTHENKNGKTGSFTLGEVSPKLFHDIFEVTRVYLRNGELVDLHDDYSNCKCFVTSDGLCGFAIEPDGNLVSVFSLSPSTNKGFLYAIKDFVRQEGATHLDAYASSNQPLQKIYAKTLDFHTASTMDYNMEYDHDDIAKNHGNPQVVFMVDHEVAEQSTLIKTLMMKLNSIS